MSQRNPSGSPIWNMHYCSKHPIYQPCGNATFQPDQSFNFCAHLHLFLQEFAEEYANTALPSPEPDEQAYLPAKKCTRIAKTMQTVGQREFLEQLAYKIPVITQSKYMEYLADAWHARKIFHQCQGLQIQRYSRAEAKPRRFAILDCNPNRKD